MAVKTKKEIQAENTKLKEELSDIKSKYSKELSDIKSKYSTLSEKYENSIKNSNSGEASRKVSLKCEKCDKRFESMADLKKHKSVHKDNNDIFSCDLCEKEFNEEWKMRAHRKNHKNYQCDRCNKTFKFADTMSKHVKVHHENVKLYCHYFNNEKVCPYGEECVFLHTDSKLCKYGGLCERMLCMFKHQSDDIETGEIIEEEIVKIGAEQIEIIDVENDESLHDETVEDEDDNSNKTFTNPSQIDKTTCSVLLKCEKCDFKASTSLTIRNHKESTHNWCTNCYSTFNSQKQLKNHFKKNHSVKD